jgi:hypothetical protein
MKNIVCLDCRCVSLSANESDLNSEGLVPVGCYDLSIGKYLRLRILPPSSVCNSPSGTINPKYVGSTILQNFGDFLLVHTASYPRRLERSLRRLRETQISRQ